MRAEAETPAHSQLVDPAVSAINIVSSKEKIGNPDAERRQPENNPGIISNPGPLNQHTPSPPRCTAAAHPAFRQRRDQRPHLPPHPSQDSAHRTQSPRQKPSSPFSSPSLLNPKLRIFLFTTETWEKSASFFVGFGSAAGHASTEGAGGSVAVGSMETTGVSWVISTAVLRSSGCEGAAMVLVGAGAGTGFLAILCETMTGSVVFSGVCVRSREDSATSTSSATSASSVSVSTSISFVSTSSFVLNRSFFFT
ncbi:hypothetical protein HO173_007854 [Letharia columbiana]|uniref:Uncharacterized protein n=1 Tax=Letharia columbiana TaxID=112416 RepID=A0A8H6L3E8_9LECA|nr:uncharacterized protein HO173_007854 [Letharia columbiana]KAF6234024.1 hypothetical protein HO173_007854 [Letharia columbiana]